MKLIKWTPQQSLLGDFDRMLNDIFGDGWNLQGNGTQSSWSPDLDIAETEKEFVITADFPGMTKKDVTLETKDGVLTLSGGKTEPQETDSDNFHLRERRTGTFHRSFSLPEGVNADNISAKFKNGQLVVALPKIDVVQEKGREIRIS